MGVARAEDLGKEDEDGELWDDEGEDAWDEGDEGEVDRAGGVGGGERGEVAAAAVGDSDGGDSDVDYAEELELLDGVLRAEAGREWGRTMQKMTM